MNQDSQRNQSPALDSIFFNRPTLIVARDLIGCTLARRRNGKTERYLITETEAYDGPADKASHASRGITPRTQIMFGEAGYLYVYFVYGIHWMLNIVTGPKGYPAAVLIRGIQSAPGPARLTKKLDITGFLNGKRPTKQNGLWFEARSQPLGRGAIVCSPRIGVDYAGPIWSEKKWRFTLKKPTKK